MPKEKNQELKKKDKKRNKLILLNLFSS